MANPVQIMSPLQDTATSPQFLARPVSALSRHCESSALLSVSADETFAYVDDHTRLSSHMRKSSLMMGGTRMDVEIDGGRGQYLGSRIRLTGRVLGVRVSVEEIVTVRDSPRIKVWETTDSPRLLVIGHYRMGFEITPQSSDSQFRVFIDYALPETGLAHWLGHLLGRTYAKWCTQQMVDDVVAHFASR